MAEFDRREFLGIAAAGVATAANPAALAATAQTGTALSAATVAAPVPATWGLLVNLGHSGLPNPYGALKSLREIIWEKTVAAITLTPSASTGGDHDPPFVGEIGSEIKNSELHHIRDAWHRSLRTALVDALRLPSFTEIAQLATPEFVEKARQALSVAPETQDRWNTREGRFEYASMQFRVSKGNGPEGSIVVESGTDNSYHHDSLPNIYQFIIDASSYISRKNEPDSDMCLELGAALNPPISLRINAQGELFAVTVADQDYDPKSLIAKLLRHALETPEGRSMLEKLAPSTRIAPAINDLLHLPDDAPVSEAVRAVMGGHNSMGRVRTAGESVSNIFERIGIDFKTGKKYEELEKEDKKLTDTWNKFTGLHWEREAGWEVGKHTTRGNDFIATVTIDDQHRQQLAALTEILRGIDAAANKAGIDAGSGISFSLHQERDHAPSAPSPTPKLRDFSPDTLTIHVSPKLFTAQAAYKVGNLLRNAQRMQNFRRQQVGWGKERGKPPYTKNEEPTKAEGAYFEHSLASQAGINWTDRMDAESRYARGDAAYQNAMDTLRGDEGDDRYQAYDDHPSPEHGRELDHHTRNLHTVSRNRRSSVESLPLLEVKHIDKLFPSR